MNKGMGKYITPLIIIICVIFIDYSTKRWVMRNLFNDNKIIKATDFLNIVQVWNSGISFGMFNLWENSNIFFFTSSSVIIIILMRYLFQIKDINVLSVGISFIIGGAVGNLMDRIIYGSVCDFIDFHIYEYHFAIFNIADAFISIGAIFFLYGNYINGRK